MAAKYYTILTKIGAALHANAQITQTTVPWTHMALGDGGGNPVTPKQEQTGLVREVLRLPITSIEAHPDNPNWIVVEAVVPNSVGGWTVRESAILGTPGGAQCIAVGNYPDTYKPVLSEGAVREMVMRMIVEISSAATVNLVIDPAVAIASRAYVDAAIQAELAKGGCKQAVRAATTANTGIAGLKTVDGVALSAGDRVLVKDQADAKTNGIYVVAAGNWMRALDADTGEKLKPGAIIPVTEGAQNADTLWTLRTDGAIVIGATALAFQWLAGANAPDQPSGDKSARVANTAFVAAAAEELATSLSGLGERVAALEEPSGQVVLSTPGIHTFSVPQIVCDGKKKLKVCGVGGGGGGGSGVDAGGGGASGYFEVHIDLSGVERVTCTVGAPGLVTQYGGTTSFGTYASSTGGGPGGNGGPGGGSTPVSSVGGVFFSGGAGGYAVGVFGGNGGGSYFGSGEYGAGSGFVQRNTPGIGGGGGSSVGGPGGPGILILEW